MAKRSVFAETLSMGLTVKSYIYSIPIYISGHGVCAAAAFEQSVTSASGDISLTTNTRCCRGVIFKSLSSIAEGGTNIPSPLFK